MYPDTVKEKGGVRKPCVGGVYEELSEEGEMAL
jgi:hypothetical protein